MQHAPHHTHHTPLTGARDLMGEVLRACTHHLLALTVLTVLALLITIMAQGGWFADHGNPPLNPPAPPAQSVAPTP
jgi:hypothetical protein